MLAALCWPRFLATQNLMQATRLKEAPGAAPHDSDVIDASFTVVRERTLLQRMKLALLAVFAAALVGFVIPPLWVLAQHLAPLLKQ
jgi:hypothetical protein